MLNAKRIIKIISESRRKFIKLFVNVKNMNSKKYRWSFNILIFVWIPVYILFVFRVKNRISNLCKCVIILPRGFPIICISVIIIVSIYNPITNVFSILIYFVIMLVSKLFKRECCLLRIVALYKIKLSFKYRQLWLCVIKVRLPTYYDSWR